MSILGDLLAPRRRLLQQERDIRQLKKELTALREQNSSMREGMRRCMTCDYRIENKSRQGQAPVDNTNPD